MMEIMLIEEIYDEIEFRKKYRIVIIADAHEDLCLGKCNVIQQR